MEEMWGLWDVAQALALLELDAGCIPWQGLFSKPAKEVKNSA